MKKKIKDVPSISLPWLDKLGGGIIIWDVKPEAMRNSCWDTLTETKWVSTDKICTITVRIIQGVEEKWGGWGQKVLYVLLKCINVFARWIFSNLGKNKEFTT